MKLAKKLLNFYINSSIHVALSVFSLAWITLLEFDILYDETVLYFIFYATISGYNFVKYFGMAKFHHRRLVTWLKLIQIVSFLSFVFMCYYAWHLNGKTLIYIGGFAVLTFMYAIPFSPYNNKTLRHISGLKVFVIAIVWAGVTVFLPLLNNNYHLNTDVLMTFVQRFIYIIVLMLPFEIRDLKYDSPNLATIPQKIGVKKTKVLGTLLLILFFFLEFLKDGVNNVQIMTLAAIMIITLVFLVFSKIEQRNYYSSLWVEGLPIVWLVLILMSI